jgi:hypothetical protein
VFKRRIPCTASRFSPEHSHFAKIDFPSEFLVSRTIDLFTHSQTHDLLIAWAFSGLAYDSTVWVFSGSSWWTYSPGHSIVFERLESAWGKLQAAVTHLEIFFDVDLPGTDSFGGAP